LNDNDKLSAELDTLNKKLQDMEDFNEQLKAKVE
jgi:hypothetical protein